MDRNLEESQLSPLRFRYPANEPQSIKTKYNHLKPQVSPVPTSSETRER
jgi:hypothetical protein